MKNKILNEITNKNVNNKKPISRIFQISIVVILLFFLIEIFRKYLPENLLEWKGIQIKTMGLMIIGIVILNSIIIPNYLNEVKPKLNEIKVVVYTGLVIFAIEIVFKVLQNFILIDNGFNLNLQIIKSAGMIGGIGMLVANIRIHKLRSKKTLIPILLLFGIWIAIGLILKYK